MMGFSLNTMQRYVPPSNVLQPFLTKQVSTCPRNFISTHSKPEPQFEAITGVVWLDHITSKAKLLENAIVQKKLLSQTTK